MSQSTHTHDTGTNLQRQARRRRCWHCGRYWQKLPNHLTYCDGEQITSAIEPTD